MSEAIQVPNTAGPAPALYLVNPVPLLALAVAGQHGELSLVPIIGDHMQPTLWRGDYVAVATVTGYHGEGLYLFESLGVPIVFRCGSDFREGISVTRDNKVHAAETWAPDAFLRRVLGKVAVICRVVDPNLVGRA